MTRLQRSFSLAAAALVATALSGCMVGPNYERPQMPAPPQHRFVEGPAEAESLADVPWWEVTKDPQLVALIREAVANNLDLRIATARVEEARAVAGISKSFLYPEVGFTGGYDARQVSVDSEPPQAVGDEKTFQNWDAVWNLSAGLLQPIFRTAEPPSTATARSPTRWSPSRSSGSRGARSRSGSRPSATRPSSPGRATTPASRATSRS